MGSDRMQALQDTHEAKGKICIVPNATFFQLEVVGTINIWNVSKRILVPPLWYCTSTEVPPYRPVLLTVISPVPVLSALSGARTRGHARHIVSPSPAALRTTSRSASDIFCARRFVGVSFPWSPFSLSMPAGNAPSLWECSNTWHSSLVSTSCCGFVRCSLAKRGLSTSSGARGRSRTVSSFYFPVVVSLRA